MEMKSHDTNNKLIESLINYGRIVMIIRIVYKIHLA